MKICRNLPFTLGWSDKALFAIFENEYYAAEQVFFVIFLIYFILYKSNLAARASPAHGARKVHTRLKKHFC